MGGAFEGASHTGPPRVRSQDFKWGRKFEQESIFNQCRGDRDSWGRRTWASSYHVARGAEAVGDVVLVFGFAGWECEGFRMALSSMEHEPGRDGAAGTGLR